MTEQDTLQVLNIAMIHMQSSYLSSWSLGARLTQFVHVPHFKKEHKF